MYIPVHVPPLRERQGDIPLLCGTSRSNFPRRMKKAWRRFHPQQWMPCADIIGRGTYENSDVIDAP